jgi:hypothetical protein
MPRAPQSPEFSEAFAVPVGSGVWLRAAIGEHRWKLGLPITDFARFINSEIALLCGRHGAAPHGDLLVGSGVRPRADRAITRRRTRRPRAWGEARGLRTTQSRPPRSRTRGAA